MIQEQVFAEKEVLSYKSKAMAVVYYNDKPWVFNKCVAEVLGTAPYKALYGSLNSRNKINVVHPGTTRHKVYVNGDGILEAMLLKGKHDDDLLDWIANVRVPYSEEGQGQLFSATPVPPPVEDYIEQEDPHEAPEPVETVNAVSDKTIKRFAMAVKEMVEVLEELVL